MILVVAGECKSQLESKYKHVIQNRQESSIFAQGSDHISVEVGP